MNQDPLIIAGRTFRSRLWVGTGKYQNFEETRKAIEASGADVVTVAVRRVNITDNKSENLLDYLDPKQYTILPNTAGCYTVEDAVHYSRLARAAAHQRGALHRLARTRPAGAAVRDAAAWTLLPAGRHAVRQDESGRARALEGGRRHGTVQGPQPLHRGERELVARGDH